MPRSSIGGQRKLRYGLEGDEPEFVETLPPDDEIAPTDMEGLIRQYAVREHNKHAGRNFTSMYPQPYIPGQDDDDDGLDRESEGAPEGLPGEYEDFQFIQGGGQDMDFLNQGPKVEKPGMKGEEELKQFYRRHGMSQGYPTISPNPTLPPVPRQAPDPNAPDDDDDEDDDDPDFEGMPGSPDMPSEGDRDRLEQFGGDQMYKDFVDQYGFEALDPTNRDAEGRRLPSHVPMPRAREPHLDYNNPLGPALIDPPLAPLRPGAQEQEFEEMKREDEMLRQRQLQQAVPGNERPGNYEGIEGVPMEGLQGLSAEELEAIRQFQAEEMVRKRLEGGGPGNPESRR